MEQETKQTTPSPASEKKAKSTSPTKPKPTTKKSDHKSKPPSKKVGRPSPRNGNTERYTLLLNEETAERLDIAIVTEKIKRKKRGEKMDKSLLIENLILEWLEKNKY